jgi:polyhydroxybutyrate depolymerase
MRLALLVTVLALGVSAASAAPSGTVARGSVQVDGQTRTYRVFVPARPKKPAAIVLVFHGGFGTGARVAGQTGFDAEAEKRGFGGPGTPGLAAEHRAGSA